MIDPGEVCDGAELGGLNCNDFQCSNGQLGCLEDCSDFTLENCLRCGNGVSVVPDGRAEFFTGPGIRVDRVGNDLVFHWNRCPGSPDASYALYEGDLAVPNSHLPLTCAWTQITPWLEYPLHEYAGTVTPGPGNHYYIITTVNPDNGSESGPGGPSGLRERSDMPCGPARPTPCF